MTELPDDPQRDRPTRSRFDFDPAALEWARGKVQAVIDKCAEFEKAAKGRGDETAAGRWRTCVFMLRRELIGGEGCTIARLDWRLPTMLAATGETPPADEWGAPCSCIGDDLGNHDPACEEGQRSIPNTELAATSTEL